MGLLLLLQGVGGSDVGLHHREDQEHDDRENDFRGWDLIQVTIIVIVIRESGTLVNAAREIANVIRMKVNVHGAELHQVEQQEEAGDWAICLIGPPDQVEGIEDESQDS